MSKNIPEPVIHAEFIMTNADGIGWCLIPPEIMARNDLSANAKMMIGRINGLRNEDGFCFASNEWLGKQIGLKSGAVPFQSVPRRMVKFGETNEFIFYQLSWVTAFL